MNRPVYAFDFETFYSRDYSVKDLGTWAYTHHPQFNAYMVSVSGIDDTGEFEWVGEPKDFCWERFQGADLIAHNAAFDLAVARRLQELGIIRTDITLFDRVYDTADLAAYLGAPRSLAEACKMLLGIELDKSTRDKAKGLNWSQMTPEFKEEMTRYAASDARNELELWLKHGHRWPEWEREISRLTREMGERGVPVDVEGLENAIRSLKLTLWETRTQIPWAEDPDAVVLSPKEAALACRKEGVEPPASWAKDDEALKMWLAIHGQTFPWAAKIGEYRSQNMLLKKLEVMKLRTRPDGVMPYGLKYAGAHTLRDSGDQGFNVQNLPKKPMHGVDLRGLICAPEGYTFGIVDLRAIEPCVLSWLAEDNEMLERLHAGEDMYEAWARITHGYEDSQPLKKTNPQLRQLCKVEVLGLGYGAGVDKFMQMPGIMEIDVKISRDQAEESVRAFRGRQYVPYLWNVLEENMRKCRGKTYEMELPSGRVLRYRDVIADTRGLSAVTPRTGKMMRLNYWGGTLTENMVQATSRDVFMHGVLELDKCGLPPVMRVHDEAVCLFREDTAENDLKVMKECMSKVPEWIEGLPLFVEGTLSKRYKK
jgi:DNA polymerase I-like protein with 3'-5' exonuclease and polymerase domains